MTAFGQLVVGAAGAGKSSYCAALDKYIAEISSDPKRTVRVVNLDPGVEHRLQTTQATASTLPDSLTGNSGDVHYWAGNSSNPGSLAKRSPKRPEHLTSIKVPPGTSYVHKSIAWSILHA